MSNVATVHIVKNQLGVAHVSALCSPSSLDTRPSPKLPTILQLDGNPLRPEGARILSCAMRNQSSIWCSLSTLRLGYCQLAAAGSHLPQRVCKITTSSHPPARWWTHRILPAGMVILPAQEWAAGGNVIAAMLHSPARSIHQRLPGAAAGAMDKTVWGCGWEGDPALISLFSNIITMWCGAGATAISTALHGNSTLVVLELPGNNMSAEGARAMVLP